MKNFIIKNKGVSFPNKQNKPKNQVLIGKKSVKFEETLNCKLCQREIVIASEFRRLNVRFYDHITSYSFCSAKCFNRRSETYQEWLTTFDDEEDTD